MAVKTITIDVEADEILAAQKRGSESFSKVIKRKLGARRTGKDLLQVLQGLNVSQEALARMDELIDARKESMADSETWDHSEVTA